MKKLIPLFFMALFICGCSNNVAYDMNIFALDTSITIKAFDNKDSLNMCKNEIMRLENLFSVTKSQSEVSLINKEKKLSVSPETLEILLRATEISELSGGAFDITAYPIVKLWGFTKNKYHVPSDKEIAEAVEKTDYRKIVFNGSNITMGENTEIDLGGIAKGYISQYIIDKLNENGVSSALISMGGNVQVLGKKPDGSLWNVAIKDPAENSSYVGTLKVSDKAVVTSGTYERYFIENGIKYHHIMNPDTGYPADSGLASVTIISEDGILADGLSTALFVLGENKAFELYRKSHEFEMILVTTDNRVVVSKGLSGIFTKTASGYKYEYKG